MKPKLLFGTGIGWSATTPLYETLRSHKIISSGISKEPETLDWIANRDPYTWKYKRSPKYNEYIGRKSESKLKNSKLLFSKDTTLDNFVEYYKLLSNDDRPYVSDFSNNNAELSSKFISH